MSGRDEAVPKLRESNNALTTVSAANIRKLTVLPARTSAEKDGVRPSVLVELPLVPPLKLKVPRASSAGLKNVLKVENVIPVGVGTCGVPVPSVHPSFCIQEMENWPAAEGLKMALFGGVAVSW